MLHGYWDVADSKINHLTYSFRQELSGDEPFNDGYKISPRGRGNAFFRVAAEEDIYECVEYFETIATVNQKRKYLYGFSMGGYGAWHLAHRTRNFWAAIAMHGSAIWYDNESEVNELVAVKLIYTSVMFTIGNSTQIEL